MKHLFIQKLTGNRIGDDSDSKSEIVEKLIRNETYSDFCTDVLKKFVICYFCQRGIVHIKVSYSTKL